MDLFNTDRITNILPYDGYYKLSWKNDEAVIFGKLIKTKRKVAWYGESQFSYTPSKVTKLVNKK